VNRLSAPGMTSDRRPTFMSATRTTAVVLIIGIGSAVPSKPSVAGMPSVSAPHDGYARADPLANFSSGRWSGAQHMTPNLRTDVCHEHGREFCL
jgi:hypothetical protein